MAAADDILANLPIAELAQRLGTDEATATDAVRMAIPSLLGGMEANAADPDGARSLESAVGQHSAGLFDGGVSLDRVDTTDGQAIVNHVFGNNTDQVMQRLGAAPGGGSSFVFSKLLPILAPIVMSYLAQRLGGAGGAGGAGRSGGAVQGQAANPIQDVLDQMLGGAGSRGRTAPGGGAAPSGNPLNDILGGGGSGGGGLDGLLGSVLGGLLGGGRR